MFGFLDFVRNGLFSDSCELILADESKKAIRSGKLKLVFVQHGNRAEITNAKVYVGCSNGTINIHFGNDGANVYFGDGSKGNYDLRLWSNSSVRIGALTTSNSTRIMCSNSTFECGDDCMFSESVVIQTSDQHAIVDLKSGKIINLHPKIVKLGSHVWLGRRSTILGDCEIGNGSIIAASSTVTKNVPQHAIVAGVPAKIIKQDVTWSRPIDALDKYAQSKVKSTN